ncbi:MAG: Cell division protein FtsA [candidate division WS6 bacterium OLB21]|nr:MAG: Cell division protein FtsA [candidate division WS6 bacterium OLB21]
MGIAGELVQGITIMADYTREDPDSKIDETEMAEVIAHVKQQAFADAATDIAEDIGIPVAALQELNSKINATYIDGVKVDNPLGFTGSEVTYRVFSTFAPSLHVNSLKEIAASLGLEVLSIEVQPYAIARAIKGARSKEFSAVIIDVGGGTTDVAVVDQGGIVGTKMFAFGGRVFSRRIQKDLDLELHDAEQMKIEYADGKLTKDKEIQIRKALKKDINIWAEGVELSLEELDDLDKYPTQFYLCGGGSALPEVRQVLLEHPWLQVLPFRKYPKTSMLFPNQLVDIEDQTGRIIDPSDVTPLALARMILELV